MTPLNKDVPTKHNPVRPHAIPHENIHDRPLAQLSRKHEMCKISGNGQAEDDGLETQGSRPVEQGTDVSGRIPPYF